ncbi:MAG: cbb3-type cytochrome oxidase assembly protein CcoS [Bacteroidota bacterium]
MSVIIILVIIALLIAGGFLLLFFWAVKDGQFDDTQSPAVRILIDKKRKVDP